MSESNRIADQLKRSLHGEAWHGPAVMELLKNVSVEQAVARPIAGAHTIYELVLHLSCCTEEVLSRVRGRGRTQIPLEDDWPTQPQAPSAASWNRATADLVKVHEELTAAINRIPEEKLDIPILEGFSGVYVTLHGQIQHNLYHAGQIALLKKAL
jgi:uncharacterized damage-inducible protein DinB